MSSFTVTMPLTSRVNLEKKASQEQSDYKLYKLYDVSMCEYTVQILILRNLLTRYSLVATAWALKMFTFWG